MGHVDEFESVVDRVAVVSPGAGVDDEGAFVPVLVDVLDVDALVVGLQTEAVPAESGRPRLL